MGRSQHRRGAALVIVAALLVAIGGLAVALTDRTVSALQAEQRRFADLALALAAESAANIAFDTLQNNTEQLRAEASLAEKLATLPSLADVEQDAPRSRLALPIARIQDMQLGARWCYLGQRSVQRRDDDGVPRWEVVPTGTPNAIVQDVYLIRGWATVGSAADLTRWRTRRVDLLFTAYQTIQNGENRLLQHALFSKNGFEVLGNAKTDSWDSRQGAYSTATAGNHGDIASQGSISVLKANNIRGNILPFLTFPIPMLRFDRSLPYSGGVLWGSHTLGEGTYRFRAINIQEPQQLTITGKVTIYVDGPVNISGGKKYNPLVFATPEARLTIIQDHFNPNDPEWSNIENSIEIVNGNESVGCPSNPERFIYASAYKGDLTFNGNGKFGGVLLMPNATAKLNGTFDFFGAFVADTFGSKNGGNDDFGKVNGSFFFHYDEALGQLPSERLPPTLLPPRLGVVGWVMSNPWAGTP